MIDFHSHILPAVDDGAKDMDISLKMLEISKKSGVNTVVSTSHCYPYSSVDINSFLLKRDEAFLRLIREANERNADIPEIVLASEVHLSRDISKMRGLEKLCIKGTKYLLLEMPSSPWTDSVIEWVYKILLMGITPIIAHDERNIPQKDSMKRMLYDLDVLIQVNAEAFSISSAKKYTNIMIEQGMLHVVGSDMHNCEKRPPCMGKAKKYITKRFGEDCWKYLMNNAAAIVGGEVLSYRSMKGFKKKSLFSK